MPQIRAVFSKMFKKKNASVWIGQLNILCFAGGKQALWKHH